MRIGRRRVGGKGDLKIVMIKQSKINVSKANIDIKAEIQDATWCCLAGQKRLEWRHISKGVW